VQRHRHRHRHRHRFHSLNLLSLLLLVVKGKGNVCLLFACLNTCLDFDYSSIKTMHKLKQHKEKEGGIDCVLLTRNKKGFGGTCSSLFSNDYTGVLQ
jgi:hypothetical protein